MEVGNDLLYLEENGLGAMPEGWRIGLLADVCDVRNEKVDPLTLDNVRYVGLEHINSVSPVLSRWGSSSDVRSAKSRFFEGDILYGKLRPYLRKAALAGFTGICSTDVLVLKTNRLALSDWLIYLLHTDDFVRHAISTTAGTNLPRTSWTAIKETRIPLPPLPEQRRITHVLSTIQRAIQAQDTVIAAARELKRSLMHRLFTYGPYAEPLPTKETEIGELPEGWEVTTLGELVEFKNGINFGSDQKGKGVLTVDVLNMYSEGLKVQLDKLYRVDVDPKKSNLLEPGDLLVVRSSLKREGVGWPALFSGYHEPVSYCGFLIRARMKTQQVDPIYLTYYLRLGSVRDLLISKSAKVAITNVNQGNLASIPVPLPSRLEQNTVIDALSKMDAMIRVEINRKNALEALFKSMLHQLMTGQVRVDTIVGSCGDAR